MLLQPGIVKERGLVAWRDLKVFMSRSVVLEVAIAFVISTMFNAVFTSMINDVFLPPISLLVGSTLVNLFYILKHGAQGGNYATLAAAQADGAVVIAYGKTFQAVINFAAALVILYVLYRAMLCFVVKPLSRLDQHVETELGATALPERKCPFCLSTVNVLATRCSSCTAELPSAADEDDGVPMRPLPK